MGKLSSKNYNCTDCGNHKKFETDHREDIHNIWCDICQELTTWKCQELPPPRKPVKINIPKKD